MRTIQLTVSEKEIEMATAANPKWRKAEDGGFWQRWVYESDPPVGLYTGRGAGPGRNGDRLKKLDTWPTPDSCAASGEYAKKIDAAMIEAAKSLGEVDPRPQGS